MMEVAPTEYLEKLPLHPIHSETIFQKKTREPEGSLVLSAS
jgi:hypothetical protein